MYPRNQATISRIVIMGNSTSDRGTFMQRSLFGFIPIRFIVALFMKTHKDRFTNGYTWADDIGAMIASSFLSRHFLRDHKNILDCTDIADGIIHNDRRIKNEIAATYDLNNDKDINYKGNRFCRVYAEGGLTSADYRRRFTLNPLKEIPRLIVSSLPRQRQKLSADDQALLISALEKASTLVIEWTGGNDLATVNSRPTRDIADRAVNARIDNILRLIEQGYRNFALITMPDLSVTPRFLAKSVSERNNAAEVSNYFNEQLLSRCNELKRNRPEINIDLFDINSTLHKVIANPVKYGFDADKTNVQFVKSQEYKKNKNKDLLPATRYVFWDDIHPTAHVHAILAAEFYKKFSRIYNLESPALVNRALPTHG